MTAGRYVLCDQSIVGLHGHCYSYLASVAAETRTRGHPTLIVGNRKVSPLLNPKVEACFSFLCGDSNIVTDGEEGVDLDDRMHRNHASCICDDLANLDQHHRFGPDDRLVFNLVHHWSITGIVRWLESVPAERRPSLGLILHFTGTPQPDGVAAPRNSYLQALRSIAQSRCKARIRVFCDTDQLAEEYASAGLASVVVLPIPHSRDASTGLGHSAMNERVQIGFLGEARFHKGFHLLPFVVHKMRSSGSSAPVDFHIHSFTTDPGADYYMKSKAQLSASANVTLYTEPFDDAQYWNFLDRCDLLLLPYSREYYHSQSSGILSDAIARRCPVVVTAGTWMSRIVEGLGNGTTCTPGDYLSLAAAVEELCLDLPRFRAAANDAQARWTGFHNAGSFVDILDDSFRRAAALGGCPL